MSGFPREIIKWIQSLDLTLQVKTPKWDLSNGYLIAEIFASYFPLDVWMHSFHNRTSLELKMKNWYLLRQFLKKKHLSIPDEFIYNTIHCKEGAAALLLERVYEILTKRRVKKVKPGIEDRYTDVVYQIKLPMHARSTASKALKNNLRLTEELADPNLTLTAQKSQKIITDHWKHRRVERLQDPARFDIEPTIGERCMRRPVIEDISRPGSNAPSDVHPVNDREGGRSHSCETLQREMSSDILRDPGVHFTEIQVKQMDKPTISLPFYGC